MLYVIASIMVVMAAVSLLSTIMALLNFMWVVAGVSAILCMTLLYGVDLIAEVIEEA